MQLRRVLNQHDLKLPGDYCIVRRCATCAATGDESLVRYHYGSCDNPTEKDAFQIFCKCGEIYGSHQSHVIHSHDPLTVTASWLCPNGCHALLTDGKWNGA